MPIVLAPAARPRNCQAASISPFARRCCSTSSQCAAPTPENVRHLLVTTGLRLRELDAECAAARQPLHLRRRGGGAAAGGADGGARREERRAVVEIEPHPGLRRRDEVRD